MKNFVNYSGFSLLIILLLIAGCKKEEEIPGQPPVVNAGTDITGTVGNTVTLAGTATDPDGDPLTTEWSIVTKPDGSTTTIASASNLNTSFVPDVAGSYTVQLSASDGNYDPVTDEVIVTVEESVGDPPVAIIQGENSREISADNENNTVKIGANYVMDGSSSYDPEGGDLTYAWEVVSSPEGADFTLTESTDQKSATFAPKTTGSYTFSLTVTDPDENTHTLEVTLNAVAETIIITQNISADTTWIDLFSDPTIPDYIVENSIDINASLTIEPGVVVQLAENAVMEVPTGGTLIAEGTEEKGIMLTTKDEAGQIYWGGILISSSSSNNSFDYVTFDYGGGEENLYYLSAWRNGALVVTEEGKVKLSNSTIQRSEGNGFFAGGSNTIALLQSNTFANNGSYPISISANQAGTIDNTNLLEDNPDTETRENLVQIYDSELSTDQEWRPLSNEGSYVIVGDISVKADLTIQAGTTLEFLEGVMMEVESGGVIKSMGTADNMVTFTSNSISEGQNWGGLLVSTSSVNNELTYTKILYSGSEDQVIYDAAWRGGAILINEDAKLKINHSEIANSINNGIYVHSQGAIQAFGNNNIHDNDGHAIYLPANMAGMMDRNTTLADNGYNTVSILRSNFTSDAMFRNASSPQWVALNGGVSYLFTGETEIQDDLTLAPGVQLAVLEDIMLEVTTNGSLKANGTADSLIVLTAYEEDGNHNWAGLLIKSDNGNEISYAKVSYGGTVDGDLFYSGAWRDAIIGLSESATMTLNNTEISNSKTYGLVVGRDGSVNGLGSGTSDAASQVESANTFSGNSEGNVLFVP